MSKLSTSKLAVIAEKLGYEVRLSELFEPVTASGELCLKGTQVRYNPYTNPSQLLEVIKHFRIDIICYVDWFEARTVNEEISETKKFESEWLEDAVLMAAAYEALTNLNQPDKG